MQSLLSRSKIFTMLRRIAAEKKRRSLGHVALEYALGALRRAHTKQKSYNRLQVASALWNCLLDLQTSIKQGAHGLVINFQQLVTSFQSDIRACRLDGLDLSYVTKLQEITREKTPPAQHQVPYTKLRSFLQELETKAKMERKTQPSRKRGDVRHRR